MIEFIETGSSDCYIKLCDTRLIVEAMVMRPDGSLADETDDVAPVDNVLASLFNQLDIWFGPGVRVSSSSLNYGYKGYFESLMNNDTDSKKTCLTMQHFYQDNNLSHESPKSGDEESKNWGLVRRHELCTKPNTFQMSGRLYSDIFKTNRLLLPGVKMRVRLSRSNQNFVLMCNGKQKYKIAIKSAVLRVHKARLLEELSNAHEHGLLGKDALYPLLRSEVKVFHVPKGETKKVHSNLLHGVIPRRVIVGFVSSAAYNGDYQKNPYEFKTANVVKISATVDGMGGAVQEFTPDFKKNHYVNAYLSLFQGRNKQREKCGNGISLKDYANGYTFYCFDFTPCFDSENSGHMTPPRSGNVALTTYFDPPTTEILNGVAFCEMDGMITVTKDRDILTNYAL